MMADEATSKSKDIYINLRQGILDYFETYIHELEGSDQAANEHVELSDDMIGKLSDTVVLLPHEAHCVLFGEYCFNMTFDDMREMYGLTEPRGLSVWYKRMLANIAGLSNGNAIGDETLRRICAVALDKYARQAEALAGDIITTKAPRRNRRGAWFVKAIAGAAAMVMVAFSGMITVNAEFRERVVNWFEEAFGEFSIFSTSSDIELSMDELVQYTPGYVPEEYDFVEKTGIADGVSYLYADETGNILSIFITMPGDGWMIDTEELDVQEIMYDGNDAFYYSGDGKARFIFSKDGYPMYIIGDLDFEECIEIANGIKK